MKITQTFDYKTIAKLNKYVHDLHFSLYPNEFEEYNYKNFKKYYKEIITAKNFIFLLLEEGKQPLGYVWFELIDSDGNVFTKPKKTVFVHQISVIDSENRKGYGTLLMDEVVKIGRERNFDQIELCYWYNNKIAKSFYTNKGFTKSVETVQKNI